MSNGLARSPNRWRLTLTVAGAAAFIGVLVITSGHGPGLHPDSMAYVGAATSLSRGDGLRVPMGKWESADSTVELTVWPPAFSAAMAVPQSLGVGPLLSARLVLAVSAAVTLALMAALLGDFLSAPALAVALLVIAVPPSFVEVHLSLLSEPLFIASSACCLFALVRGRPALAAAAGTLAVMTRYAGASAAVAAAIWFLFFESGSAARRVKRAALSSAPAALAFLLWMIHNSRVRVMQSEIYLRYYPGVSSTLREGANATLAWVAPGASPQVGAIVLLILAGGLAMAWFRGRGLRRSADETVTGERISRAAAVLLVSYLGVVLCSRLFVGGAIRFDARILAPAFFLLELALIPIVARLLSRYGARARVTAVFATALWISAAVRAEGPIILDSIEDGNDFAGSEWRESETAKWIANEGRAYSIYTNWPAAVFFDAHRHAYDIPNYADPDSLALFGKILEARHGVLAAFNARSYDYPAIDSIAAGAGLVKIRALSDGEIWAPKSGSH